MFSMPRWRVHWLCLLSALLNVHSASASVCSCSQVYREAAILYQLRHPCIVPCYGVLIENAPDSGGRRLTGSLIMELCERSLDELLIDEAPLPLPRSLGIARRIAAGLKYLHTKNQCRVVHGDLKPKNVLLKGPDVKICDFGLSNTIGIGTMASGGTFMRQPAVGSSTGGTLLWMAPEVCEANSKGHNCSIEPPRDIYAFGMILYELLTGDRPFSVMDKPEHQRLSNEMAMMQAIISGARPSMRAWKEEQKKVYGAGLVEGLESLVQSCWAGAPTDRPSATQVLEQITALASSLPKG